MRSGCGSGSLSLILQKMVEGERSPGPVGGYLRNVTPSTFHLSNLCLPICCLKLFHPISNQFCGNCARVRSPILLQGHVRGAIRTVFVHFLYGLQE